MYWSKFISVAKHLQVAGTGICCGQRDEGSGSSDERLSEFWDYGVCYLQYLTSSAITLKANPWGRVVTKQPF